MLLTVATFTEPQEAHMLRGRLWAEGIFAVVSHAYHVGNNWPWSIALGGVKVQVRHTDNSEARLIVRLAQSGELKRHLATVVGELDDRRCPSCGSTDFWKRRPIYQGALAVALIWSVGVLPPWRWIYFCNACGTKFKQRYGMIGKVRDFQFPLTFAEATLGDIPEMLSLCALVSPAVEEIPLGIGRAWICRIDGSVRGISFAEREGARLSILAVDPDFERNGIGRALHNMAVDFLFESGATAISTTAAPQTRAQKFFHAAGWRLVDAEPNGDYRLQLTTAVWQQRRRKF